MGLLKLIYSLKLDMDLKIMFCSLKYVHGKTSYLCLQQLLLEMKYFLHSQLQLLEGA